MKYVIDTDAFSNCLDLLECIKINGHDYVALQNVKIFIDRFPKEVYDCGFDYLISGDVGTREDSE